MFGSQHIALLVKGDQFVDQRFWRIVYRSPHNLQAQTTLQALHLQPPVLQSILF